MAEVTLADIVDNPSDALQHHAARLKHPDLLKINWQSLSDEPSSLYEGLTAFHCWVHDRPVRHRDDFYLLHFLPTHAQQQRLERCLAAHQCLTVAWTGDLLRLLGAYINPIHGELLARIASSPNLTADQLAGQLDGAYDAKYVANELSNLARDGAVARRKRLPLREVPRLPRNRWHYWPVWQPDSPGGTDLGTGPKNGCQEGQTASNPTRVQPQSDAPLRRVSSQPLV